MALVQGYDVVEQVTPTTANPTLRNPVLPRAVKWGLDKGDLHGSYGCWNFESVLGITIEDEEPGSGLVGKRFSQLLNNPGAGRMLREGSMTQRHEISSCGLFAQCGFLPRHRFAASAILAEDSSVLPLKAASVAGFVDSNV
jgi:hypothetical protein